MNQENEDITLQWLQQFAAFDPNEPLAELGDLGDLGELDIEPMENFPQQQMQQQQMMQQQQQQGQAGYPGQEFPGMAPQGGFPPGFHPGGPPPTPQQQQMQAYYGQQQQHHMMQQQQQQGPMMHQGQAGYPGQQFLGMAPQGGFPPGFHPGGPPPTPQQQQMWHQQQQPQRMAMFQQQQLQQQGQQGQQQPMEQQQPPMGQWPPQQRQLPVLYPPGRNQLPQQYNSPAAPSTSNGEDADRNDRLAVSIMEVVESVARAGRGRPNSAEVAALTDPRDNHALNFQLPTASPGGTPCLSYSPANRQKRRDERGTIERQQKPRQRDQDEKKLRCLECKMSISERDLLEHAILEHGKTEDSICRPCMLVFHKAAQKAEHMAMFPHNVNRVALNHNQQGQQPQPIPEPQLENLQVPQQHHQQYRQQQQNQEMHEQQHQHVQQRQGPQADHHHGTADWTAYGN
ncbi:unnamed protein product [Caenorhabditis nigoni]